MFQFGKKKIVYLSIKRASEFNYYLLFIERVASATLFYLARGQFIGKCQR